MPAALRPKLRVVLAVLCLLPLAGAVLGQLQAPQGILLYTPQDWATAPRSSAAAVGALLGGGLALLLAVAGALAIGLARLLAGAREKRS